MCCPLRRGADACDGLHRPARALRRVRDHRAAAGTIDVAELARLQVYVVLHSSIALLLSLWILPALIALLTPLRYGDVLRAFRGPLVTAFATASLLIVLPVLAADGKRLLAEADPERHQPDPEAKSAIDILVPAAFPFPNMGLIMALLFVLFAGWFIGAGSMSPTIRSSPAPVWPACSAAPCWRCRFCSTCCACRRTCSRCS
jgi:hypothetical protein